MPSLIMKTLKVKAILFSLLAIVATAFITSCSQMSVDDVEPTLTDEAVFRAILDASKGKLAVHGDAYMAQLSPDDFEAVVQEALMSRGKLIINEGFTISAEDVQDIFCVPNADCGFSEAYTFLQTTIQFENPDDVGFRGGFCVQVRPGYWICCT